MIGIRTAKVLAKLLYTSEAQLRRIVDSPESYYEDLLVTDTDNPFKVRRVVNVLGSMRDYQKRLYLNILLKRLAPSVHSHGGIRGRSIRTNAEAHAGSEFVFKTDISNFYPSIRHDRVYALFVGNFQCSPDVAHYCTKLATYRYHLAQGLMTSPILADQALGKVDERIGAACKKAGLTYTRFVDDITISGPYDLEQSGFAELVKTIVGQEGFDINLTKQEFGRLSDGLPITGVRVRGGKLDVKREYIIRLYEMLQQSIILSEGGEGYVGPYYTPTQIWGRIEFVSSINPGRRRYLYNAYRAIRWHKVVDEAKRRELIQTRKVNVTRLRTGQTGG